MTNKLYVGFSKQVELPKHGYLFIDDAVREVKGAPGIASRREIPPR